MSFSESHADKNGESPPQVTIAEFAGKVVDGKLRLDTIIGFGDRCVLYSGTHLLLNKPIAAKVFDLADAQSVAEMAKVNMRPSRRMQQVLGSGNKDGVGYVVFELNPCLTPQEMTQAYGITDLSGDYTVAVAVAKAKSKQRQIGRSMRLAGVFLVVASIMGAGAWLSTNWATLTVTKESVARTHAVATEEIEALLKRQKKRFDNLTEADFPTLKLYADTLTEPQRPDRANLDHYVFQACSNIAMKAWEKGNYDLTRDAQRAAVKAGVATGIGGQGYVQQMIGNSLTGYAAVHLPEYGQSVLDEYYNSRMAYSSAETRSNLYCTLGRAYLINGKNDLAYKYYLQNVQGSAKNKFMHLAGLAVAEARLGKHKESLEHAYASAQWVAKLPDTFDKNTYLQVHQIAADLRDLNYPGQALVASAKDLIIAGNQPGQAVLLGTHGAVNEFTSARYSMELHYHLACTLELNGQDEKALVFYDNAWVMAKAISRADLEAVKIRRELEQRRESLHRKLGK